MKKSRSFLTLILMTSSIALLLVLQYLWIRNSYGRAYDELKKETNGIFRNTIFSMRDSLISKTLESLPADSALHRIKSMKRTFWDPFEDASSQDSAGRHMFENRKPPLKAFAEHSRGDTLRRKGSPNDFRDRRDFLFRLGPDSLKMDSIRHYFAKALVVAGIDLPFKIVHVRRGDKRTVEKNSFTSETVRLNPARRYAVVISDFKGALLKEIMPQALFSVFLTLITLLAFYILNRSLQAQRRLVELKNDFISNITHELKTPITTVSVALEALKNFNGMNNPKLTAEYLDIAQNELGRLSILTDKILKTAVYEDKGIAFQMELVDMDQLITQILGSLKLVFEKNAVSVTFEKQGNDFTIRGDRDHLVNVVYNLVDNALKYTPSPAILKIKLVDSATALSVSVSDNGPGIAPEFRKKIFEKFFRIPTGDVHNVKGYGLGLSYVDAVVKSHKGTIGIESNAGGGSVFSIKLPRS